MTKKIIITALGFLALIGVNVSISIFVFDKGIGCVLSAPLWAVVYGVYIYLMVKHYLKL